MQTDHSDCIDRASYLGLEKCVEEAFQTIEKLTRIACDMGRVAILSKEEMFLTSESVEWYKKHLEEETLKDLMEQKRKKRSLERIDVILEEFKKLVDCLSK